MRDDVVVSFPTSVSDWREPKPRQERQAPMECRIWKCNVEVEVEVEVKKRMEGREGGRKNEK